MERHRCGGERVRRSDGDRPAGDRLARPAMRLCERVVVLSGEGVARITRVGYPVGSMSMACTSPSAIGQCSTPRARQRAGLVEGLRCRRAFGLSVPR
jgi:hypothetical protein